MTEGQFQVVTRWLDCIANHLVNIALVLIFIAGLLLLQLFFSSVACADTYLAGTGQTFRWAAPDRMPEGVVPDGGCIVGAAFHDSERLAETFEVNVLEWIVPNEFPLGTRFQIRVGCAHGEQISEQSGWSEPAIVCPAVDPSGDSAWGLTDLVHAIYYGLPGQSRLESIAWVRRLWQKRLTGMRSNVWR